MTSQSSSTEGSVADVLSDRIPCSITEIEDQVLGTIVHGPAKDFWPIFEVSPGLLGRRAGKRRKALRMFSLRFSIVKDFSHAEELE